MENEITSNSIISQSKDQVAADMDGEIAMMSIDSGKYHNLNSTGSRIWELVEKPCSVSEMCQKLGTEFDVSPDQCESEVIQYLKDMIDEGLVEIIDESTS